MIGFGDADSFYASAEAVRRPHLAGLPVGVLGNQGACVIARSYPMGSFMWRCRRVNFALRTSVALANR